MEISKVTEVFFSPTYSTERIVRLIGEAWEETHQEIDLSRIPKEGEVHEFGAQDLVIFGVPSYGGRVPAPAAERFRNLKGQKTPIIVQAVSFPHTGGSAGLLLQADRDGDL